jgi:hypothetical protein
LGNQQQHLLLLLGQQVQMAAFDVLQCHEVGVVNVN